MIAMPQTCPGDLLLRRHRRPGVEGRTADHRVAVRGGRTAKMAAGTISQGRRSIWHRQRTPARFRQRKRCAAAQCGERDAVPRSPGRSAIACSARRRWRIPTPEKADSVVAESHACWSRRSGTSIPEAARHHRRESIENAGGAGSPAAGGSTNAVLPPSRHHSYPRGGHQHLDDRATSSACARRRRC